MNEVLQTTTLTTWLTVHIQGTSSLGFEWIRTIDLQVKSLKFYPLNYKSKVNFIAYSSLIAFGTGIEPVFHP